MLEEKRKKALDMHLNFIVDQTEKYSSWLVKGFADQPAGIGMPGQSSIATTGSSQDSTNGQYFTVHVCTSICTYSRNES